jgi:aldehyde dehydrogenase (NAD+)
MRIAQEEIFGPVVCVLPFHEEEEVIAAANDVKYGLAGGVWTQDIKRAHRVVDRIKAGTVWINNYRRVHFASPFGGYKLSGYGRENGFEVLREYTQVKNVWVDLSPELPDPYPA